VLPEEMEKITRSVHHEGVAILATFPEPLDGNTFIQNHVQQKDFTGPILFIDGVSNPHNLGAITRTLSHFGCRFLIGAEGELPPLSAAWVRLSEGGCETVSLVQVHRKIRFLQKLKELGFTLLGTSSHATSSLYQTPLPPRIVFVLGNEITGISHPVAEILSTLVHIPGPGAVESLNVSVTAGICLNEWARVHGQTKQAPSKSQIPKSPPRSS
jgi:TrmH RNA methyltransferase